MPSNPHEPKHATYPPDQVAREPIPQWKLAAFLPLPFLIGGVYCLLIAFTRRTTDHAVNPSAEMMTPFFIAWGVCALIAYVVAVVVLGFFGHALGLKIYPIRKDDS